MDVWRRRPGEPFLREGATSAAAERLTSTSLGRDDALPICSPSEIRSLEENTDSRIAMWRANRDIVVGLKFVATMNLSVPLRVLLRHGELHTDITRAPPKIAQNWSEGIWVSELRSFHSLGINLPEFRTGTMASTIGPIPCDGGDFLKFLIVIREIVESDQTVDARAAQLCDELKRTFWCKFVSALGGDPIGIVGDFFPCAVDTIPTLTGGASAAMAQRGINTAAKVAKTPDLDLLGIKGIGPAKLKTIREWQIHVAEPDATRFDRVLR